MSSTATRISDSKFISAVLTILGLAMLFPAFIAGIVLTINAAAASGLDFFQYAMLNKFGTFMLLWNYNAGAYMVLAAVSITAVVTLLIARSIRS